MMSNRVQEFVAWRGFSQEALDLAREPIDPREPFKVVNLIPEAVLLIVQAIFSTGADRSCAW
jgi:hypothetical protein